MLIDYIYANLYDWYYKMAQNGRKVDPQFSTSMLFGLCCCGWFLLLLELYTKLGNRNDIHINYLFYGLLGLLASGIVSLIYSKNDRYQRVYDKYITSNKIKNKKKGILISICFIILPFILFVVASTL